MFQEAGALCDISTSVQTLLESLLKSDLQNFESLICDDYFRSGEAVWDYRLIEIIGIAIS